MSNTPKDAPKGPLDAPKAHDPGPPKAQPVPNVPHGTQSQAPGDPKPGHPVTNPAKANAPAGDLAADAEPARGLEREGVHPEATGVDPATGSTTTVHPGDPITPDRSAVPPAAVAAEPADLRGANEVVTDEPEGSPGGAKTKG